MTGQNVLPIDQGRKTIVCNAEGNFLTVTLVDGKEFELIFANNSVKIKDSYTVALITEKTTFFHFFTPYFLPFNKGLSSTEGSTSL